MADLSQKLEMVLDKLYNLKGDDNVIIAKINRDIQDTEAAIRKAEEDQKNNEENKTNGEQRLQIFLEQKDAFENIFSSLSDENFTALREIGLNIEIGAMTSILKDKSPEYVSSLKNEIQKYANAIETLINKRNDLASRLEEHESTLETAETNRENLISLLEQSLSKNSVEREALTVHYVKDKLKPFDIFTEDEISKLTKLIIFPDEGLSTYDINYETRMLNLDNISNPEEKEVETQEEVINKEITKDVYEEQVVEDIFIPTEEYYEPGLNSLNATKEVEESVDNIVPFEEKNELTNTEINLTEEDTELTEEPTNDIVEETSNTADLEEFLKNIGLNIEEFEIQNKHLHLPIEVIYKKLDSVDRRVITENYETLRSIGIYDGVLYRYRHAHMYLVDKELNKKLTLLRAKGISEAKITELVKTENSGLRENYETIEKRITAIEGIERKVDDKNIRTISKDTELYAKNLDTLLQHGFDLDEKEIANHSCILFKEIDIETKANILKNYLISLVKKNGKYALNVFWKNPKELISDIDCLIENDLENLIATNPGVLGTEISQVIGRIKYCEENGIPIYEGNGNTQFCDYILHFMDFNDKVKNGIVFPKLVDPKETNDKLVNIIGNEDYTEILVNSLNAYYVESKDGLEPELDEETKEKLEELKTYFEERLNAQITGKHTYKLNDVCISKNKLERNLSILLSTMKLGNASTEGVENEILLTAALYNLRQDEEILRSVVGSCLGFNEENTLGGKAL